MWNVLHAKLKSLRHTQNVFKMLKRDIQQPSCDQFQNRVSADQCHMTVLQAQVYSVQLIEVTCFFIVFCLPLMVFKWSQAQQTLLQKYIFTSSHLAFGLGYSCSCWPFGQYTGSRAPDRTRTACNCNSFKFLLTRLKMIVSNFWEAEQKAESMCFTDFLLQALARALDLWHWPKESQPTTVKSQAFPHLQHTGCLPRLSVQGMLSCDACRVVSSKFHSQGCNTRTRWVLPLIHLTLLWFKDKKHLLKITSALNTYHTH